MNIGMTIISKDPDEFPYWDFAFLDVEYDPEAQAVWMNYKAAAPQHFPLEMFIEIVKLREIIAWLARVEMWRALANSLLCDRIEAARGLQSRGRSRGLRRGGQKRRARDAARPREYLRRHHA